MWTYTLHVTGGYIQWGVSANCIQLVWCAGDCELESFMICTAAQYYEFGLMRKMRWRWAFGKFGVRGEGNGILVVIEEGKRQLAIYRHR